MSGSNNDWQPGEPARTPADLVAWQAWRKARSLKAQHDWRAKQRRIDFYPGEEASKIIDAHDWTSSSDTSYSSLISRIIEEWHSFRNDHREIGCISGTK